jgi:hypothetical protein
MRNIQALDPSICLLVAPDSSLLRYIVYLLHIVCVHFTVELFIVHWKQVVKTNHIRKTIHLLVLLLGSQTSSLVKWSIFHGKLPRCWIHVSIVH